MLYNTRMEGHPSPISTSSKPTTSHYTYYKVFDSLPPREHASEVFVLWHTCHQCLSRPYHARLPTRFRCMVFTLRRDYQPCGSWVSPQALRYCFLDCSRVQPVGCWAHRSALCLSTSCIIFSALVGGGGGGTAARPLLPEERSPPPLS